MKKKASKVVVKEFNDSTAFEDMCIDIAISIYDNVAMECWKILRDPEYVSEDIIQLLDSDAPEKKEVVEDMHYLEAFGGDDEMINISGGEEDFILV